MGRFIAPLLIGVLGAGVLIGLGIWQVQRLDWKQTVLAEIDARITGTPIAVPARPDPETDRFLPVRETGRITDEEVHVLVSAKGRGPGFRIISLFITDGGRRLLLDRGFVIAADKETPRPAMDNVTVTGNLHWPDEVDVFTPDNDLAANVWFSRDVAALSRELATERVLIIAREVSQSEPGLTPLPVDSSAIPNDHLQYAVTWFGLAAVWILMSGLLLRRTAQG